MIMSTFLLLILAGVFVGLMGGMFGFGGSSLSTPILRIFFSIPPYFALASPLPMTLISSAVATSRYQKEQFVDWNSVKKMLIVMIPASAAGAYLTAYVSGKVLMIITAVFLVYVAIRFIIPEKADSKELKRSVYIFISGALIGFLSGLLANGGGIFVVPILVLLGMKIKKAIGTSIAMVFFAAVPSLLVHWYLGHINWLITLALTIGAFPGAYTGAYITVRVPREKLKKMYGLFLLLFAIYFALFEISGL